jgi:predicted peptidase
MNRRRFLIGLTGLAAMVLAACAPIDEDLSIVNQAVATPRGEAGNEIGEAELQVVESSPLRYLQFIPTAQALRTEPYPVLCFLHGLDEAAPLDIRQGLTRHGPLRPGNPLPAVTEFIVVAPQLPQAGDLWYRYAEAVRQIVTEVQSAYSGDPERTYLTGFSFGGNGVFDLAIADPELWAALWPVDPTRVPRTDPQRPLWLSFGSVARSRKDDFIRALALEPVDTVPEGDRLYLDEGYDHVGSATSAYRDERIYRWLLTKHLPASA